MAPTLRAALLSAACAALLGCRGNVNEADFPLAFTKLASIDALGQQAGGDSLQSSVSGDGRWVAFNSNATNLSPDDPDATQDVYAKDFETGTVLLVSRATGAAGAKGNASSAGTPRISADGRYVAFATQSQLDPGDADGLADVYVRDLVASTTTLVSVSTGGTKGDAASNAPSISADGRYVAFHTASNNLDPGDSDGTNDVYVRDLVGGATTLVSQLAGVPGDGNDQKASISGDGLVVAWESGSTNLVPDDTDLGQDVYVATLPGGAIVMASRAAGAAGAPANSPSTDPSLSADGRHVAFHTFADNLVAGDTNLWFDVFIRNLADDTVELVSRNSAGVQSRSGGFAVALSGDGRAIAFASEGSDLVDDDRNGVTDIFYRDVAAGTTVRVSTRTYGAEANLFSQGAAISADGRFVTFHTGADNLVESDLNARIDVFRRGPLR